MELWIILFIWFIAPLAELAIIIVLAVKNDRQKEKISQLTEWLNQQKTAYFEALAREGKKTGEEPDRSGTGPVPESTGMCPVPGTTGMCPVPGTTGMCPVPGTAGMCPVPGTAGMCPVPGSTGTGPVHNRNHPNPDTESWKMPGVIPSGGVGDDREEHGAEQQVEYQAEPEPLGWPGTLVQNQMQCGAKKPARRFHMPKGDSGFYQGTGALIVGVIFVVLAGLIFATTTWNILPGFGKVIMAFCFSAMFFGVSHLAGKVLKIKRTSKAFYILGSVFLFLTVLAGGYFGLLGPDFIMKGENRWRVLWAGSIVTDAALFAGLKSFRDRIYIQACLWGMTVSMTFLMGAFGLEYEGCVYAMVIYSFLLVAWDEMRRRKGEWSRKAKDSRNNQESSLLDQGFRVFAPLHFWAFSAVMGFQAAVGFLLEIISFGEPGPFSIFPITPWSTLAAGLTVAGITLIALRKNTSSSDSKNDRSSRLKSLHSISLALFFQYLAMCLPVDFTYQIMIGAALTGLWFLAERWKELPLANQMGGYVFTAVLSLDSIFLVLMPVIVWNEPGEQILVSGIIVLLAVVTAWWGRQSLFMRRMVPWVLFFLTFTIKAVLNQGFRMDVRYDLILLVYVVCIGIWDVVSAEDFRAAVLAAGTGGQIIFWLMGWNPLPFFILLAVYLFAVSRNREMASREWNIKGGCLYFLAGVLIFSEIATGNGVLRMMLVTAAYAVAWAAAYRLDRERAWGRFWDCTGIVIFLMTMGAFYMDSQLEFWNLALCLGSFGGFYLMLYRRGRTWMNLAAVLAVVPVPWVVVFRYGLTTNQLYAWVGGILLVTGCLSRYYAPIIRKRETPHVSWDIDWFHILCAVVVLSMALVGNRGWRCAYTVLLGLYVLQYSSLKWFRRESFTLALILGILAFWQQPFVEWPHLVWLEIQLLPVALLSWLLALIWKDKKAVPKVQTTLYCLCLGAVALEAFLTGEVGDALILEGLCLGIFIGAHVEKCVRWARISGILAVTAALYMTKSFWLSLSWWMYLLAAGIGLIIFAAANEMKKH